jgi:hypothetical protein
MCEMAAARELEGTGAHGEREREVLGCVGFGWGLEYSRCV